MSSNQQTSDFEAERQIHTLLKEGLIDNPNVLDELLAVGWGTR